MKNVSVVGVGRLGLCFSLVLEKAGFNVMGCDIDENYVDSINSKTLISPEPHVNEYLSNSKNLVATTDLEKSVNFSDIIFITVRTTSLEDGSYDCSQCDDVINKLGNIPVMSAKDIVLSCNVNPGYSDSVSEKLINKGFRINFNPEWVAQGSIIYNQENPELLVIGEDNASSGDIIIICI